MVRYLARSCSENPVISRNLRTAFQLRPDWAACMSDGVSMLFSPSALPMRVPGMMVADPTNVAIDLVLGTAMLIVYSGGATMAGCYWQNGRMLSRDNRFSIMECSRLFH